MRHGATTSTSRGRIAVVAIACENLRLSHIASVTLGRLWCMGLVMMVRIFKRVSP